MKPIGWSITEIVGETIINPIVYVHQTLQVNKEDINSDNINKLIKQCLKLSIDYKVDKLRVLAMIEKKFPEYKSSIDRYRILV